MSELGQTGTDAPRRRLPDPLLAVSALLGALTGAWLWRKHTSRQKSARSWLIPEWLERLGSGRAVANIRKHAERQHAGPETEAGKAVTVLESTFDIAASPAEVFAVVGDPRSKLVWVPAIKRVEIQSDHVPGPGTRYVATSGVNGLEFIFHEEIVQWEPPHRLAYQGQSLWGRFRTTWVIEPAPGGSRAHYRMDYWFPGGRLGRALGWAATAAFGGQMNELTTTRLKETIEEGKWSPINPQASHEMLNGTH